MLMDVTKFYAAQTVLTGEENSQGELENDSKGLQIWALGVSEMRN